MVVKGSLCSTPLSFGVDGREANGNGSDIANSSSVLQLTSYKGVVITSAYFFLFSCSMTDSYTLQHFSFPDCVLFKWSLGIRICSPLFVSLLKRTFEEVLQEVL